MQDRDKGFHCLRFINVLVFCQRLGGALVRCICTNQVTIYAPVIYTAPCIMFWMGAYTLCGEVGGGWALDFPSFLGPMKWERADR